MGWQVLQAVSYDFSQRQSSARLWFEYRRDAGSFTSEQRLLNSCARCIKHDLHDNRGLRSERSSQSWQSTTTSVPKMLVQLAPSSPEINSCAN
mmetsp:Transcript_54456/g.108427  ORF Transcript_54456/g.108427 Transcript_54456/m.108427 type:complete len:93 (-) Transcript_54456:95-373(-)